MGPILDTIVVSCDVEGASCEESGGASPVQEEGYVVACVVFYERGSGVPSH
jgi:hypothetical protein